MHQQNYGANPYQQGPQAGGSGFGGYGNFMSDPTAQMGFQVGQTALKHGTEYVEQNVSTGLDRGNAHELLTVAVVQPIRQFLRREALF